MSLSSPDRGPLRQGQGPTAKDLSQTLGTVGSICPGCSSLHWQHHGCKGQVTVAFTGSLPASMGSDPAPRQPAWVQSLAQPSTLSTG